MMFMITFDKNLIMSEYQILATLLIVVMALPALLRCIRIIFYKKIK